jgi:hypothetical protein
MIKPAAMAIAFLALAASVPAQAPAGGEFRVNTFTPGFQASAYAAMEPDGDFIVLWTSDQLGSSVEAYGQRYSAGGIRRGSEFLVNTYTTGLQRAAGAATGRKGDMIVVWEGDSDGSATGIKGQRYDASGSRIGAELLVNTFTPGVQDEPTVARGADGRFVVAWRSLDGDGSNYGIAARRYDASGAPLGAEFVVNTYTTGFQAYPTVAMAADGRFVIVWEDYAGHDGSLSGIFGQRYGADGARLGGEFQLNSGAPAVGRQDTPAIAMTPSGEFAVTWRTQDSLPGPSASWDVAVRRFDASATPIGFEFLANSFTTGHQITGRQGIASDALGNLIVTWDDILTYADGEFGSAGVFAQRFTASGARRGNEFHVNTFTPYSQRRSSVVSDEVGNFVVTWDSQFQDGGSYGVFAQRYGGLIPAALRVEVPGDGILEPGDRAPVRPSWRNDTGAQQNVIETTLSDPGGPPNGVPQIIDGVGGYGPIATGAAGECISCYIVQIPAPPTRPVLHWDASAVESVLIPDTQGQQKRWLLHVGRSFTDVPSTNPFYRFVETLLHHGVTGGCSATGFCPSAPVTREQMAVFVLVAKEGTGYVPPACTTPIFGDVPASNPFCRWIEELARRGVVGGCGPGSYCPSSPVTREQMAVFVLRMLDSALNPPACTTPMYNDVPASSPFCRWIEELTRRAVVSGCGGGNYCPTAAVTREQMGVFISVTFGLLLYGV